MSFGDIILMRKLGIGVLTVTGAMTCLLGGWILLSAFSSEPNITIAKSNLLNSERKPSSILPDEPYSIAVDKSDTKVESVALGCLKNGVRMELKSLAKQIRLKSHLCGGRSAALDESSIINRSNGFVATLFNLDNGHFTSDYISLDEGLNQLIFEFGDGAGVRASAEITILRGR